MKSRGLSGRKFRCGCFGVVIGLAVWSVQGLWAQQSSQLDTSRIRRVAEKKFLSLERNRTVHRYRGDRVIPAGEILNGHVVVFRGSLDVYGTINGDILVIGGNVLVRNDGWVNGDITSIGGKVEVEEKGHVLGNMLETHVDNLFLLQTSRHRSRFRKNACAAPGENPQNGLLFRYNRVEGLFLGWDFSGNGRHKGRYFSLYGFGGYGFKSKAWRYAFGIRRWFIDPRDYRLELGFDIHDLTDTKDLWRAPYLENTLAALFLREDFHDYFRRMGYRVYWAQSLGSHASLRVEFRDDDYRSMSKATNWSVFGGKKVFRENPGLGKYEGKYQTLRARLEWDNRKGYHNHRKGWKVLLDAEVAPSRWSNTTVFERYVLEVRGYFRVSTEENVNARIILGASRGDLPIQKNFELGGIGTLRGYPFKMFPGNQMVLANLEYVVSGELVGHSFMDDFYLILFADAGVAWMGGPDQTLQESWKYLHRDRVKSDLGIAIATHDGDFRINLARPFRAGRKDVVLTVRISRPF